MASYNELSFDWNTLCQECSKWTRSDLQLAAELGKTLLERNKELESTLKQHQNVIEDQALEIEYLQKQTVALREVNDSRLRIYEQIEVSIQDLERSNHRLAVENASEKKHNKSLSHINETLESRCEDLTKSLEDTRKALDLERRKNERIQQERLENDKQYEVKLRHVQSFDTSPNEPQTDKVHKHNRSAPENCSYAFQASNGSSNNANSTAIGDMLENSLDLSNIVSEENEELIRMVTEMETLKKALMAEQERVSELEEQHAAIIQENKNLQSRIAQASTNEDMRSVHDELSILDEVRQGTMCSRCLRSVDDRNALDEGSSIVGTEDDDDRSLMDVMNEDDSVNMYKSAVTIKISPKPNTLDLGLQNSNPYRELVEKYEALLEVQRHSSGRNQRPTGSNGTLQDEFPNSSEYSSINTKDTDEDRFAQPNKINTNENGNSNGIIESCSAGMANSAAQPRKNCNRTPTDFSETETTSSGYSDETSNKATQTEERQGYFLCSIGDGDDCKFSIYDDASPIDSRFRNRPEYRELFREIFAVLKKAAENKEDGESLPLLDDSHPALGKVPPVTPANEELPTDFGDDSQSIISSVVSEQSFAMSECITKTERKTAAKKHIVEKNQENKPPAPALLSAPGTSKATIPSSLPTGKHIIENGRVLTPLKREPLEYLSVSVAVKKKNRKKNRNLNLDRSDSPILPSPPRVYYSTGKRRRDVRPFNASPLITPTNGSVGEWNGSSMVIYNRNMPSPNSSPNTSSSNNTSPNNKGREVDMSTVQYKPSSASQDLHKLKKLELSYAEVLRRADICKQHHRRK